MSVSGRPLEFKVVRVAASVEERDSLAEESVESAIPVVGDVGSAAPAVERVLSAAERTPEA